MKQIFSSVFVSAYLHILYYICICIHIKQIYFIDILIAILHSTKTKQQKLKLKNYETDSSVSSPYDIITIQTRHPQQYVDC